MYLQLYQLEYIAWDHYIQSFIFILSTIPSFHSWLQYTYTVPWCLWLPQKYWQNFCFCQQTPIFDIEHTKHYYRHQQALQIIQYTGSCLGVVYGDQRPEKKMCSWADQQLQQQDMPNQTWAASWKQLQQWSSFFVCWCLPANSFCSTVLYWLIYCQLPETGYSYSVVKFCNTATVLVYSLQVQICTVLCTVQYWNNVK